METLKPGRELDALVAEKVMGYPAFAPQVLPLLKSHLLFGQNTGPCLVCGRDDGSKECLPPYSTDIAAAMTVEEKIGILDSYSLWSDHEGWHIGFRHHATSAADQKYFSGLTASHVICLAALEATKEKP